jgi:Carboxypeptidase regulatory-like domain/PDZ domain
VPSPLPPPPPRPTPERAGLTRPALLVLVAAMVLVPLLAVLVARTLLSSAPAAPPSTATASAQPSREPETVPPVEDRTPEIHGRILDADGNPVDGAAVRLVSPSPPYTVLRDTKTDAAGRFSFARVPAPRVRVVADHDPGGVVTSAELRVAEGQSTEVTLVLSAASAVRGTVVDGEDHPVEGATLSVEGVPWIVRSATTDPAGAFRMETVPQEATSLVAVARGYKTAHVPLANRDDQTELVVRVRLSGASPVEGDVRDVDSNPIKARVVACEGQPSEARIATADDGTFTLPPTAIGCDAIAEHDELGSSDPVSVLESRHVSLRLKPGGTIEGAVVDDRGGGIPSFSVGIESFTTARGRSMRGGARKSFDDVRGSFRWEKLAPGTYTLTASAPGKPPTRSDPVDVVSGITTRNVRIVLSQGGTVTGHVFDERHEPLAGVEMRFDAASSVLDSTARARTDETGLYRLEGAPAGPFTLRAQKEGFRLRMMSGLRVGSRGTLTQDVVLTSLDGGATFEFGGIGASLEPTSDGIAFGMIFPGNPADRAGIQGGDRILRIDGDDAAGLSVADVLQRLRGQAGTTVGITVRRPDTGQTMDLVVERAAIVR